MSAFIATSLLVGFRLLPLLVVAPVMVFKRLPILARTALTIALASVFASTEMTTAARPGLAAATWIALVGEFVLGAALAFGLHAATGAVHALGTMLDQQTGLAAAAVFDPNAEQSSSIIAELMTLLMLAGFLGLNGHHALLRGFSLLLAAVPPGSGAMPGLGFIDALGQQFSLAFMLAAPVVISVWLVDFAIALISRAAPQANIYFVAMPIKLIVGLLTLAWLCQTMVPLIQRMLSTAMRPLSGV